MIQLTIINDDYDNRKMEIAELDSDAELNISIIEKNKDEDDFDSPDSTLVNFFLNKESAEALISYIKQQFKI